ncbi:Early nodulin-like protein 1, partial [Cucurbita argyrosperma subsp. argyrosperma]
MKTTSLPPLSVLNYMMILSTAIMAAAAVSAAAFEFKVGDEMGWQLPKPNNSEFYSYWASINRFQIGDSLSFEYNNDSVVMVEKWDYYHCNSSDPILSFDNGKGVIKLDRAGAFYFISGFPDHCKNGQRLLVQVLSPPLPDLIGPSPEAYDDDAPSPSSNNAGVSVQIINLAVIFFPMAAVVGLLLL